MSLKNVDVIDGKEPDLSGNLVFYLEDELQWIEESEKEHLLLLQDKLNTYLAYIQRGDYKKDYPAYNFKQAIIEIKFHHNITEHCKRYLQLVKNQIEEYAIKLEVYILKEL